MSPRSSSDIDLTQFVTPGSRDSVSPVPAPLTPSRPFSRDPDVAPTACLHSEVCRSLQFLSHTEILVVTDVIARLRHNHSTSGTYVLANCLSITIQSVLAAQDQALFIDTHGQMHD